MKVVFGSPGTRSGLLLRTGQFSFAGVSIAFMLSAFGFSNYTAFCYLVASMGLQALWSLGLACLDIYAIKVKRDLHNHLLVSLFIVGDWSIASMIHPVNLYFKGAREWHKCLKQETQRQLQHISRGYGNSNSVSGSSMLLSRCDFFVCEGHELLQIISSVFMRQVSSFYRHGFYHLDVCLSISSSHVLDPDI